MTVPKSKIRRMSTSPLPPSRPDSQLARATMSYSPLGSGGVKSDPATTMAKLGFVSPAYETGRQGTHGIVGGVGYLSPSYTTLLPATAPRGRDPALRVYPAPGAMWGPSSSGRQPSASTNGRGGTSSSPQKLVGSRVLTDEDRAYLAENEKKNQEAYEAWRRARDSEIAQQKSDAKRCEGQGFLEM